MLIKNEIENLKNIKRILREIAHLIVPISVMVLFVIGFILMPIIDKSLEPSMEKFNEWANEKTKDMPNPSEWYYHWNFKTINSNSKNNNYNIYCKETSKIEEYMRPEHIWIEGE